MNVRTKYPKLTIQLEPNTTVAHLFESGGYGERKDALINVAGEILEKMAVGDIVTQIVDDAKSSQRLASAVNGWSNRKRHNGDSSRWTNRKMQLEDGKILHAVKRIA